MTEYRSDSSSEFAPIGQSTLGRADKGKNDDDAVRSALHYAVGRICQEEESGQEDCAQMTSEAISALTELVYQYTTTSLANDLVSFSRHANRRTITVDDVKLILRKDPDGLLSSLDRLCESRGFGTSVKGKRVDSKKTQKGTLLEAFDKSAKTGLCDSDNRKKSDNFMSTQESSSESSTSSSGSDVEIPFGRQMKAGGFLESSNDEMSCRSGSHTNRTEKKKSAQKSDDDSDESDDEPVLSRLRRNLKLKQPPGNKAIDLTEDG
uniref:Centromere protein S n=1 Tax=Odontella aurita TaxID=265563 RepID=A0A7S4KBQ9_9STRA|mmetsp:Transcript_8832/g.26469  ORF Transcript_8832/g.26469 Transcript_8832/m.26469 type:complete len:264 (+) Transcript_8832:125-916(+)